MITEVLYHYNDSISLPKFVIMLKSESLMSVKFPWIRQEGQGSEGEVGSRDFRRELDSRERSSGSSRERPSITASGWYFIWYLAIHLFETKIKFMKF